VTIFDGGGITLTTSAIDNPYLFTARRYDPESGNYYYRARMYSPQLGRFLSQDPLGFEAGDYNLYRYAFNNPVNLTDPTGEFVIPVIIGGIALALKIADYAWTAWDVWQSYRVLKDECASDVEKLLAGLNIALSVVFEVIEPDDLLPIGLPADDIARRQVVRTAKEEVEEAGIEGFERAVRDSLDDDVADQVFGEMGICFEAGTLVAAANGSVPIEIVSVGDLVWAVDPATGTTNYFTVTKVFSRHVDSLLEVVIADDWIRVTEEHPFWVADEGWVGAEDLEPGDCVQTLEGTCSAVVSVQVVTADTWVYNFTVATAHTYFVADDGYLVHNQCRADDFYLSVKRRARWTEIMKKHIQTEIEHGICVDPFFRVTEGPWGELSWGEKVWEARAFMDRLYRSHGGASSYPLYSRFRASGYAPSAVIRQFMDDIWHKFILMVR
jgi:RHS repeat-associated protein